MARLRSCSYCGKIHRVDFDCGRKPVRKKESTEQTKLRTCRMWDKTRKEVRERDGGLCRVCLANHVIMCDGLETHHIVPIAEAQGLAYDIDNLITLCVKHHKDADAGRIDRAVLLKLAKEPIERG